MERLSPRVFGETLSESRYEESSERADTEQSCAAEKMRRAADCKYEIHDLIMKLQEFV